MSEIGVGPLVRQHRQPGGTFIGRHAAPGPDIDATLGQYGGCGVVGAVRIHRCDADSHPSLDEWQQDKGRIRAHVLEAGDLVASEIERTDTLADVMQDRPADPSPRALGCLPSLRQRAISNARLHDRTIHIVRPPRKCQRGTTSPSFSVSHRTGRMVTRRANANLAR